MHETGIGTGSLTGYGTVDQKDRAAKRLHSACGPQLKSATSELRKY